MKRLIIVLLILVTLFAITSCGGDETSETPTPEVKEKYNITWIDENGNQLAKTEVTEGNTPSYTYSPTDTAEWDYTFLGWSTSENGQPLATLPAVSGNVTYYAIVSKAKIPQKYNVTWIDENGNQLAKTEVTEGNTPSYTYSPTDTAEWDYTFLGWSTSENGQPLATLPAVSGNATYYAKVSGIKQKYTVSFYVGDGTSVNSQQIEYGAVATEPEEPRLDGWNFVGWSTSSSENIAVDWTKAITTNVTYYAVWNEKVDFSAYLTALLNGYELSPYNYIPETMRPGYSANLINPGDIITDYSSFVDVDDIISHGYGEQWNMILNNIQQSQTFFNVLSVVEGLSGAAVAGFNNYLDTNTADTASYEFKNGIYNVTIYCDKDTIFFIIDYTATLPALGEQTVQIALSMDIETSEKQARIQLGDANALTYVIKEDSYEFAIKYLGVRRAYFSIKENTDGSVVGHIYEHLTVSGVGISSAADFYITEDYTVAVGNKASSMIGFTGTIAETYDTSTGKLIGYEVEETLSSIVYNTVFLDLDCFDGLTSIKYEAGNNNTSGKFYINGMSKAWENKKVGGFSEKMLSRRYDIEFRTQYFYYYDAAAEQYVEVAVQVPMLFVQEENYGTLLEDIEEKNDVKVSINVGTGDIEAITTFYGELLAVFKENKNSVTADAIIAFIGDKITITE